MILRFGEIQKKSVDYRFSKVCDSHHSLFYTHSHLKYNSHNWYLSSVIYLLCKPQSQSLSMYFVKSSTIKSLGIIRKTNAQHRQGQVLTKIIEVYNSCEEGVRTLTFYFWAFHPRTIYTWVFFFEYNYLVGANYYWLFVCLTCQLIYSPPTNTFTNNLPKPGFKWIVAKRMFNHCYIKIFL